uniref:Uncharacterized protein n=1 Tax=Falco tinnunculus TaxID=100819 RepID=A0A8C4V705_FALTI
MRPGCAGAEAVRRSRSPEGGAGAIANAPQASPRGTAHRPPARQRLSASPRHRSALAGSCCFPPFQSCCRNACCRGALTCSLACVPLSVRCLLRAVCLCDQTPHP